MRTMLTCHPSCSRVHSSDACRFEFCIALTSVVCGSFRGPKSRRWASNETRDVMSRAENLPSEILAASGSHGDDGLFSADSLKGIVAAVPAPGCPYIIAASRSHIATDAEITA